MMEVPKDAVGFAKQRYDTLATLRENFLERGRKCAALTIPALLPQSGHNGTSDLDVPYQSVGARGVNNLAAKLLLALFPPNTAYFKLGIDELTLENITQTPGLKSQVDLALAKVEKKVMSHIEAQAIRVSIFEALKQVVVVGNSLIYLPPSGGIRVFRLDKYVVKRDPAGRVMEIVVREEMLRDTMPKEAIAHLHTQEQNTGPLSVASTVEVFTHVYFEKSPDGNDKYVTYQEVCGKIIPETQGSFPADKAPWIALRGVKVDGEDYGRSHVEEYSGDLVSLEKLSKAINDAASLAAAVKYFVRPGGVTRPKQVAMTPNGGFVYGDINDIQVLQLDKHADLRVVRERAGELETRLAFAFLLNTAIQRPGERVTAEEIRYMARELEDGLGGMYSLMSQELQLPFTKCIIHQLEEIQELPDMGGMVKPTIVTGLDAIGRGQDLSNLTTFIQGLSATPAAQYVNWGEYTNRLAVSLGINTDGLIKTEEQIAQEQEQAQMMAMAEKLGPNAVNQMGNVMSKQMAAGAPPNE